MITPINFQLEEFSEYLSDQEYRSIKFENLSGSELVDNLILLRFIDKELLSKHLKEKYDMDFMWLENDPTPEEFGTLSNIYGVMFSIEAPLQMNVYVQLGRELDIAALQVDVPNYVFNYIFVAGCNYNLIHSNVSDAIISMEVADFRPLLVFRRLILDCMYSGGTDIHFESVYVNKQPKHSIRYRIKRELEYSSFDVDFPLTQRVVQMAVSKLSTASSADLDSASGVTTDIADLFGDGKVDLRLTGHQVSAGLYVVIAIQETTTTLFTVGELGFPKPDVKLLRDLAQKRTGLTLVTGEMRSGKNTTIFAMLNEIVDQPIRILEYSNPVENRMPFPQLNYKGDIGVLKSLLRLAKKEDIDIAVINEIPNADVAFAVRDLVNSAIGVITTTHINRVWHAPNKLWEFFGTDYKSIISQLNVVVNQKMFRRWYGCNFHMKELDPMESEFHKFAYKYGVRKYAVPDDMTRVKKKLQPFAEIMIFTDEIKTQLLNFDEMWRAETLLKDIIQKEHGTIEYKLARYINAGVCLLEEMRKIY